MTSRVWQTTCTLVRSGEEAFCLDSPVLPDELELLPAIAEQARLPRRRPAGHARATGTTCSAATRSPTRRSASAEPTARGCATSPGAAQRELREFDEENYVERPRPLGLPARAGAAGARALSSSATQELELHPADGHTADGMAIWIPWARVLVCGDYLSPVEIPMLSPGGSRDAYLATLERLEPLVEQADHVVPGHGAPLDPRAGCGDPARGPGLPARRLPDAPLPLARRTGAQKQIHEANVAAVAS